MSRLYEVLGVQEHATQQEIKTAYRKLAKKYHPDLNPGDDEAQEKLKEINTAYEVLGHEERRQQYDRYGDAIFQNGNGAGAGAGFGDMGDIFSDLFSDLFGGGAARGRARRTGPQVGADVRVDLQISFKDAVFGSDQEVSYTKAEHCHTCHGKGYESDGGKKTCERCHGSGQVSYTQDSMFGRFIRQEVCDTCQGTGEVIENPCGTCGGEGLERKKKKLRIKTPKGVDNGDVYPLQGEGHDGKNGGPPGDLYIVYHVKPHEIFQRSGLNVHFDLPISFTQATLGGDLEIPTLDGTESFELKEGTQTGEQFRLQGRGIENRRGQKGDLFFTVHIDTPRGLNDEQKELLRQFAAATGESVNEHKKGFFDKVKDLFD